MDTQKNQSAQWQHPYVDVFKVYKVFDSSKKAKKGNVSEAQDNNIGKRVLRINGSIQTSNYIQIPDPQQGVQSLGLLGRYVYLEFLPCAGKYFMIHLDFNIKGQLNTFRLSISNMFDKYKNVENNILQIPYPQTAPLKWTIMVLDVQYFLQTFEIQKQSLHQSQDLTHVLKQIQICSTLSVRGIFTGDLCYSIESLPKDMDFKPPKNRQWNGQYQIVYYPKEIDPDYEKELQEQEEKQQKENLSPQQNLQKSPHRSPLKQMNDLENIAQKFDQIQNNISQKNFHAENLVKRSDFFNKASENTEQHQLRPYPICKLSHAIGFSGNYCKDIKWSRTQEQQDELIYASGSLLISSNTNDSQQRFFLGHTSPICSLDIAKNGKILVSAQEGKKAIVRIWDYLSGDCITGFQCPYTNIKCVSLNYDSKLLATVGTDELNRDLIIIWNITDIEKNKKPELFAKKISEFDIISLRYSPTEIDKLVSCGKENIRFWRIKNQHIPGQSVILNHHARNSTFLVLDFEFAFDDPSAQNQFAQIKRVFVGSKQGMLFQVNYQTKELETVYKCHEGGITSISLSSGFCITGSEDCYLRVWPLDFSEFSIEAKHEGVLLSLDISLDALRVACGTSNGGLGILDLSNNNYKTFLRSHINDIIDLQLHPYCNYLITLSADMTIRLWDMEKYEQVYEFSYPQDDKCLCISCNPQNMTFAAGFSTGVFRIFDIEKTCIIEEISLHQNSITHVQYSPDAKYLLIGDQSSRYSIYDCQRNYQLVKNFDQESKSTYQFSAFTQDNELLAIISDSGTHINIIDCYTFQLNLIIYCQNANIKKLFWAANNCELFCLTEEGQVKVFGIQKSEGPNTIQAYFLREVNCIHRNSSNSIALSNNYKYLLSVGGDNLLKVWDYDFSLVGPGSNQIFLSHTNSINQVIFIQNDRKIITAGGFEGIYEWEFLGDCMNYDRVINFNQHVPLNQKGTQQGYMQKMPKTNEQQPLDFLDDDEDVVDGVLNRQIQGVSGQQVNYFNNQQQQILFEVSNSEQSVHNKKIRQDNQNDQDEYEDQIGPLVQMMQQQKPIIPKKTINNSVLSAASNVGKFAPQRIQPVQQQEIEFKKQKKRREKKHIPFNYEPNKLRKDNHLPFKHYYLPNSRSEQVQEKILKIRDNKEEFITEQIISYNNDSHENVVWNYMGGWFAYSTQNFVIIENLTKNRNQKIITLPDQISCLTLSRDFRYLLAGSASYNQKDQSNIYVLDCKTFTISKTLIFHTRGVQNMTFSQNGKHLVTIGNFKECTVAVWEFQSSKLLAHAYTLDRINDVKISQIQRQQERIIEFCTVGRDTIQFWELDKQLKLNYFDVFIPKQSSQLSKNNKNKEDEDQQAQKQAPEVTALDYILFDGEKEYVVAGLSTGEIVIVEYGNYKILYRCQVSLNGSEIIDIKVSNQMHRLVVTAMDENIHYWDFERIFSFTNPFTNNEFLISWARLKISAAAISIYLDPTFKEGFVGLYSGGISYVHLDNKYRTQIAGTINKQYKYETQILNERLMVTTHEDGRMKLWNILTGEEVMEYKFQSRVTSILFESKTNKLFCFFENNNDIKSINTQKFYQAETFLQDEVRPSNKKSNEYPIKSFETILGGRTGKFVVMKSGEIFIMDQLIKERRPLIKFSKVFHVPNVVDLIPYLEKSLFFATNQKGKVMVYSVDYVSDRTIPYGFTLVDECDFLENTAEQYIKQNNQQALVEKNEPTQIAVSYYNDNSYYAINSTMKYVFVRNYYKRQIIQRINLNEFPLSIALLESKMSYQVLIGSQNGSIEKINIEDKDNRETYTNMLDGGIFSLHNIKSNNNNCNYRIIASTNEGISIYSI